MGMFDSFYGADGVEWQTKAYDRSLDRWDVGDVVPGPPIDYQAEVIGGPNHAGIWSYVTMRGGVLASTCDKRDESLPVLLYGNAWLPAGEVRAYGHHENG